MKHLLTFITTLLLALLLGLNAAGQVTVTGDLKRWHKVTLTLDGPFAAESDDKPNPFTDLAFNVTFTHESGSPKYIVPGYFAADGNAANSSAESGTKWLAHLSPDKVGAWTYRVSFTKGKHAALNGGGQALAPFDGVTGSFKITETDKTNRDFRAHGRLQYVGKHHLQFAGSKQYFLKAGPDAPETLLAYTDFDNTSAGKPDKVLPENDLIAQDFRSRDKSWDYCRIALDFFHEEKIPFAEMTAANALIGNTKDDNSKFCFAKVGELYLVYLPDGGESPFDLTEAAGKFSVKWFNPREGGVPTIKGAASLNGGSKGTLTAPSADDWLAVIAKETASTK